MRVTALALLMLLIAGPTWAEERTGRADGAGQNVQGDPGGDGDPRNDLNPGDDYYKGWCCSGQNYDYNGDGAVDQADREYGEVPDDAIGGSPLW